MIENLFIAQNDQNVSTYYERSVEDIKQRGLVHTKVAGKYEIVQELPKEANSLEEMLHYADAYGNLRFAYIHSSHEIGKNISNEEKDASAFGGELGVNTASYYGFHAQAAVYISQSLEFANPSRENRNEDFFNTDVDSFAYLALANIGFDYENFSLRIGRIALETPYANMDDIRMAANTFEGVLGQIEYFEGLHSHLFAANRWAGYDSQDEDAKLSQDRFKDLTADGFGIAGASLTYEYARNSEASFWYSYIDRMAEILYGEVVGIYFIEGDKFHFDYGVQYASIKELEGSGYGGNVIGLMGILNMRGIFFGASYNKAFVGDAKSITDGFGGGPYYTSLDETTIATISELKKGEDVSAYKLSMGYNLKKLGLHKVIAELVYGEFTTNSTYISERNVILSYEVEDKWNFEAIYTKYLSDSQTVDFDRALVRVNYQF